MVHVARLIVLLSGLFVSGSFYATAQNREIDSLKVLLRDTKIHDTTRLFLLSSIMERVKVSDSVGVHYNTIIGEIVFRNLRNRRLTRKEKETYLYYQAFWYTDKATELFSARNGRLVVYYLDQAIAIFRQLKMDDLAWNTMINKGHILRKMNAWDEAISAYFTALKHLEASGYMPGVAAAYGAIAQVYDDQSNYPMALTYYKKAIAGYRAIEPREAQAFYEEAIMLHNLGYVYYQLYDNAKAKASYLESLEIGRKYGFSDHMAFDADKIGTMYLEEKNYAEALAWFEKGLEYAEKDRSRNNLLLSMGKLYFEKKDFARSLGYYRQALVLAQEWNDPGVLVTTYYDLYKTYKALNRPAEALRMHELYLKAKDDLKKDEAENQLLQQQLKYDYEKKELLSKAAHDRKLAAIRTESEKENVRRNAAIVVISVVFLIGGAFLVYYFRQKTRMNASRNNELKQKLLLTQMNPHFIFNSIDTIQSLIYNKQEKEAISYLTKFSRLTRQILENSRENYILLSEEIAMLDNYLTIQKLLYNNHFTHTIEIGEDIDPESLLVPPMLTQPFIENAVRHGLKNKQEGGLVHIQYYTRNNQLHFEVSDNGSGLLNEVQRHKSLSTQITRERLQSIASRTDIVIQTANIVDDNNVVRGVKTWFEIPYVYNT